MMRLSRRIGRFKLDRIALGLLLSAAAGMAGHAWLRDNPQHNPWAPLELDHKPGWATAQKLDWLRGETAACRAILQQGGFAFTALGPSGEGACLREDRTVPAGSSLSPGNPQMTCLTAAGLAIWMRHGVQPAAERHLGARVQRVEHLGTYNCRRIGGGSDGGWSEHARGNAIDIAAFVLEDGRRISVLDDWESEGSEAGFLHSARDAACASYSTVLSPDYNAAHADHLHLDQADRLIGSVCR